MSGKNTVCAPLRVIVDRATYPGDSAFNQQTYLDIDFIAHSREDVPELLAEVERLTAENADLKEHSLTGAELAKIAMMQIEFKKLQDNHTAKAPISELRLWPDGRDYILHTCPKCHEEVSNDEKYCSECGQKLLWEK
jgi:PHP family Zn ribbon phosphoesterase